MPLKSDALPRLYVVEDDPALRKLVRRALVELDAEVAEFSSAEEFLKDYSERPIGCVLLDLRLPGMDGFHLLQEMAQLHPPHAVIILSAYGDVPSAVKAMRNGAVDFIQKPFRTEKLVEVVRAAFDKIDAIATSQQQLSALTPRERDVLEALRNGDQNKVAAARLGLSPRTVEMHRARIFKKLGVANLSQALLRVRDVNS